MSFSSSALAHRQVGGLLKLCRLLRHLWGSCTHQLKLQLVWIYLTLANTGSNQTWAVARAWHSWISYLSICSGLCKHFPPNLVLGQLYIQWCLRAAPTSSAGGHANGGAEPAPPFCSRITSPLLPPSLSWHLCSPLQQDVAGSPWAAFPIQAHFSANESWKKKKQKTKNVDQKEDFPVSWNQQHFS